MKRLFCFVIVAATVTTTGCAGSLHTIQPISYEKRLLVAVGDVQNQTGSAEYNDLMDSLTGSLINELQETECFRLIERQRLKLILEEMKLGTGLVDPKKTKEVGRLLGADAILFVNLALVTYSSETETVGPIKKDTEKISITMDARLTAVETGEIYAAAKARTHYKNSFRTIDSFFGTIQRGNKADKMAVVQESLDMSLKRLVNEIAWKISKRIR